MRSTLLCCLLTSWSYLQQSYQIQQQQFLSLSFACQSLHQFLLNFDILLNCFQRTLLKHLQLYQGYLIFLYFYLMLYCSQIVSYYLITSYQLNQQLNLLRPLLLYLRNLRRCHYQLKIRLFPKPKDILLHFFVYKYSILVFT